MNPAAVSKAKARLAIVTQQIASIEDAKSHEEFANHWYLFLLSAKNIYTMLEQGAKASAQSRQWFGGKKQERREDPLLQYLFQARDDDEHGIGEVTRLEPGRTRIGVNAPGASNAMRVSGFSDGQGRMHITELQSYDGKPIAVQSVPYRSVLAPVQGRGGIFEPPTMHKGAPIKDTSPLGVAKLCVEHLAGLIVEAEGRTG